MKHIGLIRQAACICRLGSHVVSVCAVILALLLAGISGFTLWDTHSIESAGESQRWSFLEDLQHPEQSLYALHDQNPDVIAWIKIIDTRIDQPVVQGEDDMEYINKDATGEFSLSGAVFLSSDGSPDFSDPVSLTYGHHMDHGGMYGDLDLYLDPEFLENHHTGTLQTLHNVYDLDLFAILETDENDSLIYIPARWQSQNLSQLLEHIEDQSLSFRSVKDAGSDQILLLSTCKDQKSNQRIVAAAYMKKRPAAASAS